MSKKDAVVRVDTSKTYNLFEASFYVHGGTTSTYTASADTKKYTFMAFNWADAVNHAEAIRKNLVSSLNKKDDEVSLSFMSHKGEGYISYAVVENIVRYNEGKE